MLFPLPNTARAPPATDKVWATHLGFALCLSFVVVFGISFHATGYMIADPYMRGAVRLVIALTVFMLDRGLRSKQDSDELCCARAVASDP